MHQHICRISESSYLPTLCLTEFLVAFLILLGKLFDRSIDPPVNGILVKLNKNALAMNLCCRKPAFCSALVKEDNISLLIRISVWIRSFHSGKSHKNPDFTKSGHTNHPAEIWLQIIRQSILFSLEMLLVRGVLRIVMMGNRLILHLLDFLELGDIIQPAL